MLLQSPSRNSENATPQPLVVKLPKDVSQQVRNALTGRLRRPKTKAEFSFEHDEDTKIKIEVARPCERTCTFTATSSCGHKATQRITAKTRRKLDYSEIHTGLKSMLTRRITLMPQAQA